MTSLIQCGEFEDSFQIWWTAAGYGELCVWFKPIRNGKIFWMNNKFNYYTFKLFPCFWLVKTTRIIHHHLLLFTKFGKNLCHIESMTSKVQPAENYWTDDVKMTSKVQPAADYWTVHQEKLGTRLCYIWWPEETERNGKTPLRTRKYFEWIIKQLLGVIHLDLRPLWITPSLICRILHILLTLIQ